MNIYNKMIQSELYEQLYEQYKNQFLFDFQQILKDNFKQGI